MKITDKSRVPRELYDYTAPQTNVIFKAHAFGLLVVKVREHYVANQIAVPENFSELVESDYCARRPDYCYDPNFVEPLKENEPDLFADVVAAVGIPMSDALAAVSTALGVHCTKCQRRHRIIKEIRKVGVAETIRRLKETFHG